MHVFSYKNKPFTGAYLSVSYLLKHQSTSEASDYLAMLVKLLNFFHFSKRIFSPPKLPPVLRKFTVKSLEDLPLQPSKVTQVM